MERDGQVRCPLPLKVPTSTLTRLVPHFPGHRFRWIKFEEDVEEGGNRWSKPHVATLSLHSLFELRSFLLNGTVMLDMEATSLEQIADLILDNMSSSGSLTAEAKDKVSTTLETFPEADIRFLLAFP